jgi:large subunit ribosomal protein L32e
MKILLDIRKKLKAKKPTFLRTDSNRKKYKNKWRKPRGLQNKRRLNFAGHQKNPSQGYRSPREVRGLHTSGLKLVNISSLKELQITDLTNSIIEISSKVGIKNKIQILEECKTKKIQIANMKDIDKFIKESNKKLEEKRKKRQKKVKEQTKSKADSVKKAEEKKKEGDGEKKQEKVKEEVMHAKQKEAAPVKETESKQDSTQAKTGHQHSSVPGTKQ